MSTLLDSYDVEAAFEEELKRITEGDYDGALQGEEASEPCSSGTDSEDGYDEPSSLQLLRVALARREHAAEEFGIEWHKFCLETGAGEFSASAGPGVQVASLLPAELGFSAGSSVVKPGPDPDLSNGGCIQDAPAEDPALMVKEQHSKTVEDLGEPQHRTLSDLDHRIAIADDERQAAILAAVVEQEKIAAETEALARKLELARRIAAEREALHEAQLATLRQRALQVARQHMAAWRIGRAWHRYCHGTARAARLAAVVCIQASWRGYMARRKVPLLRAQRAALQAVEEAVTNGHPGKLRLAISLAHEMGLDAVARNRLTALEVSMNEAAQNLRTASAGGSYAQYQTALAAAKIFPCLAQLVAASSDVFGKRQTEAEATVWGAVEDTPLTSFHRLLDSVAPLGIEPQQLTCALAAVRQRDERVRAQLEAMSRVSGSSLNSVSFEALAKVAERLGLQAEAAAAHLLVERRRRSSAAALRARLSTPLSNAKECLDIADEARRLGLTVEAEKLIQHLVGCQSQVQVALQKAVKEESVLKVVGLFQHALDLQVPVAALQASHATLSRRRAACSHTLLETGACSAAWTYFSARGLGVNSGVAFSDLMAADRLFMQRRRAALSDLVQALGDESRMCVGALSPVQLKATMSLTTGLAAVQAVVERILKGMLSPPAAFAEPRAAVLQPLIPRTLPSFGWHVDLHGENSCRSALPASWSTMSLLAQLGLPDAASLTGCAMILQLTVHHAEGSYALLAARVVNDSWGDPMTFSRMIDERQQPGQGDVQACEGGSPSAATRVYNHIEDEDQLAKRMVGLMGRYNSESSARPWTAKTCKMVWPLRFPHIARGSGMQLALDEQAGSMAAQRLALSCVIKRSPQASLAKDVVMRSSAGESSKSTGGVTAWVPTSFCLDLGLERLVSLQGLDSQYPAVRSLSTDANQLSSLEGLQGLTCLQELSLKHNHLTSLVQRGQRVAGCLPSGTNLQRLVLDSNLLSGQLQGLRGCSGLRVLSLTDNRLSDIGSELESCNAVLTCLSLRSNCMTSLPAQLSSLTSLRELDVSGNRLTSLDGLQGLLLLQSLYASSNAVAELPKPFFLPHLTELDLGQNALTTFGDCEDSSGNTCLMLPSLKRLVLRENSISRLGYLGSMIHLTMLDLSFNNLASYDALRSLEHVSALRSLNLSQNPIGKPKDQHPGSRRQHWTPPFMADVPHSKLQLSQVDGIALALPCLHELSCHDVTTQNRLANSYRATRVSSACAIAMTRRLRSMGACNVVSCSQTIDVAFVAPARPPHITGHLLSVQTARHRAPWRARLLTGAVKVPVNPMAMRSTMEATTGIAAGCSAGCSLYAEMACSVHDYHEGRVPYVASTRGERTGAQEGTSVDVSARTIVPLVRLGRLWDSALPSEHLHFKTRQLLIPHGCGRDAASIARGDVVMIYRSPPWTVGRVNTSAVGKIGRSNSDLLDFASMRCLRPTIRALDYLSGSAHKRESGGAGAMGQLSGAGCEASALVLRAEVHGCFESSLLQAAHVLLEEARVQQQQQQPGRSKNDRGLAEAAADPRAVLTVRPSYFVARVCPHADKVATIIQACWRGLCGRRIAASLRVDLCKNKETRRIASTVIQAWWRGHSTRKAMRTISSVQHELRRREAAATVIKAHYRGYRVRKQLRAALAAVLLPSDNQMDADLMFDNEDLDTMLEFLSPVQRTLDETHESNQTPPRPLLNPMLSWVPEEKAQALRLQQQGHTASEGVRVPGSREGANRWAGPLPGHTAMSESSALASSGLLQRALGPATVAPYGIPDFGAQFHGHSSYATCPPLQLAEPATQLATAAEPVHLHAPEGAALRRSGRGEPAIQLPSAAFSLSSPVSPPCPHHASRLAPKSEMEPAVNPGPLALQNCCAGQLPPQFCTVSSPGCSSALSSSVGCTGTRNEAHEPSAEIPTACTGEQQQNRHLNRMHKLMTEWGFKDLATAEAYHRRALRQKQGPTRRKGQDKGQDSALRHLRKPDDASNNALPPHSSSRPVNLAELKNHSERTASGGAICSQGSGNRNLASADSAPVRVHGHADTGSAGRLHRSASQDDVHSPCSADIAFPASSRRILAPLGPACVYEVALRTRVAQRPHHLPSLTNNNWIIPSPTQTDSDGRMAPVLGHHIDLTRNGDKSSAWTNRRGTDRSDASTPEVLLL